jgi:hypothetical protein
MKRKHGIFLGIMAFAMTNVFLFAQDGEPGKASLTLDFSASAVSVNNDGDFDSFTDAGFGDDSESTLGFSYENEFFGGTASFAFSPETLRILDGEIGDIFGGGPLSIDELYAWVKPFGPNVTFTGGIFENTDGLADYTDDTDIYEMGVFSIGEEGPFVEPGEITNPALTNGFLAGAVFGPLTVQLLLAPNYSEQSASDLINGTVVDPVNEAAGVQVLQPVDTDKRFFRLGGRVSADIGVGTVSALFKTFQWPMEIVNTAEALETGTVGTYPGSALNFITFGAYADITAVENLGVSVGYTGYTPALDDSDYGNILYSGIDLRATWTGIPGLSLSTHNNISFAAGVKDDWLGVLGDGDSFVTLFNAVGVTKELTEKFSVNGEIANVFSKTDRGSGSALEKIEYDAFEVGVKLITKVTENVEFKAGLKISTEKNRDEDAVTVFSVPIGILVSY